MPLHSNKIWDVHAWNRSKKKSKTTCLNFSKIENIELSLITKIYLLDKRLKKQILPKTGTTILNSLQYLSIALGARKFRQLVSRDFYEAEQLLKDTYVRETAVRMAGHLVSFASWLNTRFRLKIDYAPTMQSNYLHGRKAFDDDCREEKLLKPQIIRDLLLCKHREDLSDRDRFFISLIAILIVTGFRINELLTLPKDCLVIEEDSLGIRAFISKKNESVVKPIIHSYRDVVIDAYQFLLEFTERGRAVVRDMKSSDKEYYDWTFILRDERATRYFVKKFAHEWTSNERNYLFNKSGAWFEKEKEYIDIVGLKRQHGSFVKLAKHLGIGRTTLSCMHKNQVLALENELPLRHDSGVERVCWDTDSRVISIQALEKEADLCVGKKRHVFEDILVEAQIRYQLKGKTYPCPTLDKDLETKYKWQFHSVLETRSGEPLLKPEDALFVINKYQLSSARRVKEEAYSIVDDRMLADWLTGQKRSIGTKKDEDSVFSRLDIFDETTGEIAHFVSHDIRHWLHTYLAEGGMSEELLALFFNRNLDQNHTYDQTSSVTRLKNLRKAISNGEVFGEIPKTFKNISDYSKEQAMAFLFAETLMINIMPHGGCTLNWGMERCPHNHSCLSIPDSDHARAGKPCESFVVDGTDANQVEGLKGILVEVVGTIGAIKSESPQRDHLRRVAENARDILSEVKVA